MFPLPQPNVLSPNIHLLYPNPHPPAVVQAIDNANTTTVCLSPVVCMEPVLLQEYDSEDGSGDGSGTLPCGQV